MDLWKLTTPVHTLSNLLFHTGIERVKADEVINAYMCGDRHYHNIFHICTLWEMHRQLSIQNFGVEYLDSAGFTRVSQVILYHDAVYDAQSKTNERDSAEWWRRDVPYGPDWTAETILATADHLAERPMETNDDKLREWIVGLDLAGLAGPWEVFSRNNRLIRIEYSHVSDADWRGGRTAFIEKLGQTRIFRDPILHDLFEERAHDNIAKLMKEGC